MSEAEPKYRFSFYRPSEVYFDAWVAHPVFGRVNFRLGSENGIAMLAYLMQASGQPDGDIVATEIRRKVPLVQYFESLHGLAAYRQPGSVPPLPVIQALARLQESPLAWAMIPCKADLLAREYVVIENGTATLTAAGTARLAGKGASDTISVIAYTGLRQVQMGHWTTIDARAKIYLVKNLLVDGETVTEAGLAAMTAYEAEHGRPEIAAPVEKIAPPPRTPRESTPKKTILSDKQIEAFRIALKQPYRWDTVPGRTRNVMIANNWITVNGDHLPKLTVEGQRVYDMSLDSIGTTA